ncbi:C2 family cysteine protease [Buttiauxella gaviniae]|uniref:C2 family cysteine protease n=1 Tax=Buttiauxella gaviniae TaxID=82990 RepID=A0ABV3NZM5_9ENTR
MSTTQDTAASPDINTIGTWTQSDYALLTAGLVSALTSDQIKAMVHPEWIPVTAVTGLTAGQVAVITPSLASVSAAWLNSLAVTAFQGLTTTQIGQITSAKVASLDNIHLNALTATQVTALNGITSLSSIQFSQLNLTGLSASAIGNWSHNNYSGLTAQQITTLSDTQIKAMQHPDWMSASAATGFSAEQLANINISFSWFSSAWVNNLSIPAFQSLSVTSLGQISATTWTQIDFAHVSALNSAQIGVIKLDFSGVSADWLNGLSLATFQGLTATQIGQLTAATVVGLSDARLGTLTATQTAALNNLSQLSGHQFSLLNISAMSIAQIATWTPDQYATLTPAEFNTLSTAQIGAIANPAALPLNIVSALTVAQVNAINTDFSKLPDTWLNSLSTTALQGLTPYQFSHLSSLTPAEVNKITSIAALSNAQFSQLNLTGVSASVMAGWSKQVWAGLTAAQVSSFTAAQIDSFQHASWLPATAAAGLLPWQMAPLSANYSQFSADWFNHLQLASFTALDTSRLNQITTSALSGMDTAHLAALSAAQVASMNNLGSMASAKFGVLNISALSTSQIAALTLGQYQGLTQTQLSSFSATQIQALAHPEWLASALINNTDIAQFAALTPAQLASLKPGAIASLDAAHLAVYSGDLKALTPEELLAVGPRLTSTQIGTLTDSQRSMLTASDSTSQTLINSLSDAGLKSIMQSVVSSAGTLFSFSAIESVMKALDASLTDSLSTSAYTALQGYVQNIGQICGKDSSVYSLANGLVNGAGGASVDWVNTDGTFTRIGSLNVGSSATQFNQLISTWFDGADIPVSSSTAHVDGRPLFANGTPTINDIHQGQIGDCWVLSTFQSVVNTSPDFIKSMVVQNSNDTYSVRFFRGGNTDWVTVDNNVCSYGESSSSSSWAAIYERAYLQYRSTYSGADNTYAFLDGGLWDPLEAMTGDTVTSYYTPTLDKWNSSIVPELKAAVLNHQPALISSWENTKDSVNGYTDFVSGHQLAIIGFDDNTDKFIITNPWGADSTSGFNGTFEATTDQMWEDGKSYVAWANSNVATGAVGQLVTAMASIAPTSAADLIAPAPAANSNNALLVASHAA